MKNRGQFFLVGALAIIVIIFSLGETYVYANAPFKDNQPRLVTDDLKNEGHYLIDQSFLNNQPLDNISSALNNLTYYYSLNYPSINFTIIYGYPSLLSYSGFTNGAQITVPPYEIQATQNNVTLNLNNRYYYFNLTEGYNFFVISEKGNGNEVTVSAE